MKCVSASAWLRRAAVNQMPRLGGETENVTLTGVAAAVLGESAQGADLQREALSTSIGHFERVRAVCQPEARREFRSGKYLAPQARHCKKREVPHSGEVPVSC